MVYAILPGAALIQLCIMPLVDPPGVSEVRIQTWHQKSILSEQLFRGMPQFYWTNEAVFWISLSALAAFFVDPFGFFVLASIHALAHVMLGQLKSCAIILSAYIKQTNQM